MIVRYAVSVALILLVGCRQDRADSGATIGGTPADTVVTGSGEQAGAGEGAVEFEAPRLIPGMLAQLKVVEDSGGRLGEGSATGYRQAAGTLVDAMLTDINRVGAGDDGGFRALGDSVVMLVGGGAGEAPEAEPEKLRESAALMRRAIDEYQQRMRLVQN